MDHFAGLIDLPQSSAAEHQNPHARDLDVVRRRVMQMLVGDAQAALQPAATRLAGLLDRDGVWPQVDYQDQARSVWKTAVHLLNTLQMAAAYATTSNVEQKPRLLSAVSAAVGWWVAHDPQNPNWWWNQIGAPRLLGEVTLFVGDDLPQAQRPAIESILKRADWTKWTGQNLVWGCQIQVLRGLLTREQDLAARAFSRMYEELRIASPAGEGIVPDLSFHQHGPQLYSGGYGLNFAADVGAYLCAAWNTAFEVSANRLDIFTRYVLDGEAWMMRGSTFDYSACGREITRRGKSLHWRGGIDVPIQEAPLSGGIDFPDAVRAVGHIRVPRADEFAALAARMSSDNSAKPLVGNRHFWCSDYMAHHRREFFASVRMFSARTVNTELINDEGKQSHHLADGCTLIYRHGFEYRDVFPVWDWSKVPGTTAEQMDLSRAGEPRYKTDAAFVGGVSDGHYGVAAQHLHRETLSAHKAWFFFDEGFVALGAGITCDSQRQVVTSVNQCLLRRTPVRAGASVWHDDVAYVPLGETRLLMTAGSQTGRWSDIGTGPDTPVTLDVLKIWVDHGAGPKTGEYAYVVLAGVAAADVPRLTSQPHLQVLRNTRDLQAVHFSGLQLVSAVFWSAGSLEYDGRRFDVDRPCLLMAQHKERITKITVSNPTNEAGEVTLTTSLRLSGHGAEPTATGTKITIALPGADMAGASVTREFESA